jgi:hypothetical protein
MSSCKVCLAQMYMAHYQWVMGTAKLRIGLPIAFGSMEMRHYLHFEPPLIGTN